MNSLHATAPLPVRMAPSRSGPAPWLAGVLDRIARILRRRRHVRPMHELVELDDRLLDDIGLTREQVVAEARGAAWFFEPASPRLFRNANGELW